MDAGAGGAAARPAPDDRQTDRLDLRHPAAWHRDLLAVRRTARGEVFRHALYPRVLPRDRHRAVVLGGTHQEVHATVRGDASLLDVVWRDDPVSELADVQSARRRRQIRWTIAESFH